MTTATIKNWAEFQHYKDRSPPWLKLHRKLLDDRTFHMLPIASKALAPMLWLLAAENMEGRVDITPDELVFRLRWKLSDIQAALPALIEKGFLILDSAVLAPCQQVATPEAEAEGDTKKEQKHVRPAERFLEFWKAFPRRKGTANPNKKGCLAKWKARGLDALADTILSDIELRKRTDSRWKEGFPPDPETYINQDRWDDDKPEAVTSLPPVAGNSPAKKETPESRAEAEASFQRALKEFGYGP